MDDPDRIEIKRGGGWLMLLGLPFFAGGLLMMFSPLWGGMKDKRGQTAPAVFVVPFGAIFLCVGAGFVFGRSGVVLDRRARAVTKWWGLLTPFRSTTYALDKFKHVTLAREVRRSKNSTYTVFPFRLLASAAKVTLGETRDFDASRAQAEKYAKFLGLGIRDISSGSETIREAGTLDESLREKVAHTGEKIEVPRQPAGCKTRQEVCGDEAVFEIPPPGLTPVHYAVFACGALGTLLVVFLAWSFYSPALGLLGWVPAAFFLIPLFGLLAFSLHLSDRASARERITVSTRGLKVARISRLRRQAWEIPADELEELELVRPVSRSSQLSSSTTTLLVARSDRVTIEFGAGLSTVELIWLRDVIRYLVTAPKRAGS